MARCSVVRHARSLICDSANRVLQTAWHLGDACASVRITRPIGIARPFYHRVRTRARTVLSMAHSRTVDGARDAIREHAAIRSGSNHRELKLQGRLATEEPNIMRAMAGVIADSPIRLFGRNRHTVSPHTRRRDVSHRNARKSPIINLPCR